MVISQLPEFSERLGRLSKKHAAQKGVSLRTPGDSADLGRMLAKIAHGYAVAELGYGNFEPYLLNIILGKPPMHLGHYVGGLFGDAPKGADLHEIRLSDFWGSQHVAVEIHMFADRSLPKYLVIAGKAS
ncbi:hypothetical protein QO058_01510 [Bosea vestrisii]|uniref:hypothetical protein n=1 Tax=Bosea vestrisii TaxID=151416 RepID=UPI0024E010B7|nr:hypothetical protein [Bosea vestrisii]WID96989.1 hypothetical protein QO058_01510 [Bosea vestrisii]